MRSHGGGVMQIAALPLLKGSYRHKGKTYMGSKEDREGLETYVSM